MKACGVSAVGADVTLLRLPEPPAPEAGQLLVEVDAAGVGPWDRLLNGTGWDVGLRTPAALGVEGAGRVVAVGPGVEHYSVGDRVLAHEAPLPGGSGFWAERVLITAAGAAPCPPELDAARAAALPVAGLTAYQALAELALTSGQRLLITNGGGATGALALQIAASRGIEVTVTASAAAVERLSALGAAAVVDYRDPGWAERVPGKFDAALVAAGGTAHEAMSLLRDNGRLISLTSDAPAGDRGIVSKDLYVRPDAAQLGHLAQAVVSGKLRQNVTVLPSSEGPTAFASVTAGQAGGRKIVLIWTRPEQGTARA
ncbi:NADP-dependent oxidoreductase [Actinacidiphila rubida]|uniref:NADPH:quinone reductase n=1 Tax=Actinacidiphila rubida TaxID=310780 RepID=A0A1H8V0L3_9ACTN|nr:NADP-dependent oxidoreductase [Actinacidiphila rubida]SEP08966.1 NADPH:quinone reductase [Actinacidiphila rubida]